MFYLGIMIFYIAGCFANYHAHHLLFSTLKGQKSHHLRFLLILNALASWPGAMAAYMCYFMEPKKC